MEAMGCSLTWIAWVRCLYSSAESKVLVNGHSGHSFQLHRSVCQGCPLAPYLFLIAANVLPLMLNDPVYQIEGLLLPNGTTSRSSQFADDTNLLLLGTPSNLDRTMVVLDLHCEASGSKLNWTKTRAIWASDIPRNWTWRDDLGLVWLQEGQTTKHLRCLIGFKALREDIYSLMVQKIRDGIQRWNKHRLSLAGRILVVNQVILGSIWYIATCATTSSTAIAKITALVRDYVWSGKFDHKTRARIRWASAILPITQGGMQVLDPTTQIQALLTKNLVRGMQPGTEPWKVFIQYRIHQVSYKRSGQWPAHIKWILQPVNKLKLTGSILWRGIVNNWSELQSGLEHIPPFTPPEILREPLFGNRFIVSNTGLPWGIDPGSNFHNWAKKGITTIGDFWNEDNQDWRTVEDLRRTLNSRTRVVQRQLQLLIHNIPWRPTSRHIATTQAWVSVRVDGDIVFVYHIQYEEQGHLYAH